MSHFVFIFLGILTGAAAVVQSALNARFAAAVGHSVTAALVNSSVGVIFLLGVCFIVRAPISAAVAESVPLAAWSAGVIGALFIVSTTYLVGVIGTAKMVVLLVAGQALMALVVDHYGLLGVTPQPISSARLLGCGLVVAGIVLTQR